MVYSDVGDTKKAIEMLRVVTERDPSPRTLEALAQSYDQVRDYKSAAEVLKKAIELSPDNARFKRQLAQNLLLSEQYDDALNSTRSWPPKIRRMRRHSSGSPRSTARSAITTRRGGAG